ncbi:MAG: DUF1980 domain-containing protein, partial [Chloroflexi bacterium]
KPLLLFAFTIYFIYTIVTGHLARYMDLRFAWMAYLAAGLFALLAMFNLYETVFRRAVTKRFVFSWPTLIVLAAPLIIAVLLPTSPAQPDPFTRSINLDTASPLQDRIYRTDPSQWDVLDWLQLFNSTDDLSAYDGQQVSVLGYVYREDDDTAQQFHLAHDATSTDIGISVEWEEGASIDSDSWVRIRGVFIFVDDDTGGVLILHPNSIETAQPPLGPHSHS